MRRLINIMLVLCCLTASAMAQRITGAEYFFNHDPGIGSAVPIGVQGEGKVRLEASIEVSKIPEGFNTLYFRFKDDKGLWSLAEGRLVYVERIPLPKNKNISTAEYFFDHDPGIGRGIAVQVAPDGTVVGQVGVEGLEEGFHSLFFRFKDNLGLWSLAEGRLVFVEKIPLPSNKVAAGAEYFFDTDPGIGNGQSIAVGSNGTIQGEVETTGLQSGFHHLYVRIKDNVGQWSLAEGRMVFIEKIPELVDRSIVRAEYFFDKDPGLGQAKAVIPNVDGTIIRDFDTNGMEEGFHKLFVRYQDDAGLWGQAEGRSFLVYDFQDVSLALDQSGRTSLELHHVLNPGSVDFPYGTVSFDKNQFGCTDIGENTIKVTITDPFGEVVETTVKVPVFDDLAPVIKTRDLKISLGADGTAKISPADVDAGTTDNCGIAEMEISRSEFTCADVGNHIIVFTAKDHSGNEFKNQVAITVVDELKPTVKVKNIEVELNASGTVSIAPSDVNDGSFDNCGIKELRLSQTSFTCSDVGQNQLTFTVIDNSGNEAETTVLVMVRDTVKPIARTKDVQLQLNSSGQVSLAVSQVDNGSSDNCGIKDITLSKTEFGCSDLGENKVLFKVVDHSGNEAVKEITITITDPILPSAKAKNVQVVLDEDGMVTIDPASVNNGSTDNCGIQSIALSKTVFTCSDLGENTVTLVVTDHQGNESSAEAIVTVLDETAPVIKTKSNIQVKLDEDGVGILTVDDIDDGSTDNCNIVERTLSKATFDPNDAGEATLIYTVVDASGNTASKEIKVTVDVVLSTGPAEVNIGNQVKLYPNPTKNLINISYERMIDDQLKIIEIIDINGRVMRQIPDFDRTGNTITVDVERYPAGTYMVRLISNRNVQVLRFNVAK